MISDLNASCRGEKFLGAANEWTLNYSLSQDFSGFGVLVSDLKFLSWSSKDSIKLACRAIVFCWARTSTL